MPRLRARWVRLTILLAGTALATVGGARSGAAQLPAGVIVERPIAFDGAHKVFAITPRLASRLSLAAPGWTVSGDYREARLYSVDPLGGYVLVIQRESGVLERHALGDAERAQLESAIDAAIAASGRAASEGSADAASEPAGNSFARRQLLLSAVVFGPLAASLPDDGSSALALYLVTTGSAFFISYDAAKSHQITRAQSYLASNLGIAAGGAGVLVGYAATGNTDRGVRGVALGAALAGTVAGVSLGAPLTDAEAHAAWSGIETGAASGFSIATITGATGRGRAAAAAGGEAVGYALGVAYPRAASYSLTAGDVDATQTVGLVGALAGGALVGGMDHPSTRTLVSAIYPGYVAGLLVGDLSIARHFDLSESDATLVDVGAVAGGLIGVAIPVILQSDNTGFLLGAGAVGAAVGVSAVIGISSPHPEPTASSTSSGSRFRLSVAPTLVGPTARRPGLAASASVRF